MPKEHCSIQVKKENTGSATVPASWYPGGVGFWGAEKKLNGTLSPGSKHGIQGLCASAKVAGDVDYQAFLDGMEALGINFADDVGCQGCRYNSGK